ncbi:MAG: DNA ligase D [Deltaproteobacteria bacterium]|nr:DNA ligase D [Deltaproteobacteria bacterium]
MNPNGNNNQDDSLHEYARKRDFSKTAEPRAGKKQFAGGIFVIQKHAARALHYDFRLELDGVLKSWAIPKGPSLNPEEKRLAVRVEDHPIEYANFEGIIPKGEYGGGTVMLWDQGFWLPDNNPHEGLSKGVLKFRVNGRKLHGGWALVRLEHAQGEKAAEGKENWMLIKEKDSEAREIDLEQEYPFSIATGRSMQEISAVPGAVWSEGEVYPELKKLAGLPGAVKTPMPKMLLPQLATLVDAPPEGAQWLHELKYDGYRVFSRIDNGEIILYTRNGNNWTAKFPTIANALLALPLKEAWIDGEVVFLKKSGVTSFEDLQNALSTGNDRELKYFIFDIVYYNGYDLSEVPLVERKELTNFILRSENIDRDMLKYSDDIEGSGERFFRNACSFDIEGIISKRKDSPYRQGRTSLWVKVKCHLRQEFVIGGYSEAKGARKGFGALLLGVFDSQGQFIYTGRVGTGFNEQTLADLWKRIEGLVITTPPFANPPTGIEARGVHWIRPELVIEVEFSQWTKEGVLRHPSFQGIREDKPAKEVMHESPESLKSALEQIGAAEVESPKPETIQPRRKAVRLSSPDKILYPEHGYTKSDIADYYESVAGLMLPHLSGRPLTLIRCPEGYDKECFFQKHLDNAPKDLKPIKIKEKEIEEIYLMADSIEGILGLVQMGVLEIHTWGCRYEKLEYPDKIVFDIDPDPSVSWRYMAEAVYLLREFLNELGLKSFLKTTGGKGLHVVVPLDALQDWEEVKAFSKAVADYIARGLPDRFTSMMTKSKRTGKLFLDYMRNMRGATAIEAYSTRAKWGATIAMPVFWEEAIQIRSDSFNIKNLLSRIKKIGRDPWEDYFEVRQSITEDMKKKIGMK